MRQLFNNPKSPRAQTVAAIPFNELYKLVLDKLDSFHPDKADPDAFCQDLCVKIEKKMGIYPNVTLGTVTDEAKETVTYTTLQAANIARNIEWDTGGNIDLPFRGVEMAGECGEACNVIKKIEREKLGLRGSRATKEDLAGELADLVICTYLTAMTADIDLDAAVIKKFNETSKKYGLTVFLTRR